MKTTNTCHQCKIVNICRKYQAWQTIGRAFDTDLPEYIKKLPELMAADCEYYNEIEDSALSREGYGINGKKINNLEEKQ